MAEDGAALTPAQSQLVAILAAAREPIRLADIAAARGAAGSSSTTAAAATVLTSLVRRGLVQCSDANTWSLTAAGRALAPVGDVTGWRKFLRKARKGSSGA